MSYRIAALALSLAMLVGCSSVQHQVDNPWIPGIPEPTTPSTAAKYGDDAALDALYVKCGKGDMGACDDLYTSAMFQTPYWTYGASCGGKSDVPLYGECAITPSMLP